MADTFEARAWALYDAANELLCNLIDAGQYGPEPADVSEDDSYPRDEEGAPWYDDLWALKQTLEAFDPPRVGVSVKEPNHADDPRTSAEA